MSAKRKVRSIFLHVLLGRKTRALRRGFSETRRRLLRRPHVVSVFLQLDDPYSYLLSHFLPSFADAYDVDLRLYLSEALGDAYQPAPDMLAEYAVKDCERLARELGIPFLDKGAAPPVEHRLAMLEAIAACQGTQDFNEELSQALSIFWRGDAEAASRLSSVAQQQGRAATIISASQAQQVRLGHYNSAMLHYAGEWYWGVDRLTYLLDRLDELGAARGDGPHRVLASIRQAMQVTLPVAPPTAARGLPPLELFYSIRSPYSYLALGRIFDIVDAYGLELRLRPVLPMVMRGMRVPRHKLLYIIKDAAREAERRGVAFGKIADPVGPGTERCLAVFHYAELEKRGRDFLQNAGEAIWSQAIDVSTDAGLRAVTDKTGLFWPDVKAALAGDEWRAVMEANRESMMASGSWGVPTLRMQDFVAWGQDRDWLLVRHIEELCDTGDGILV
ncbi:MAG: 2-hydroxychromene-2-carboxylate isomerase [Woeseiaceae bacterium]|nr:2-hydroxychromene-2-carboxylate isomerase [Woeseiaceae bacterium]